MLSGRDISFIAKSSSTVGLAQIVIDGFEAAHRSVRLALVHMFREISCSFVDRVLTIRSHTIHEITPSDTKEEFLGQASPNLNSYE
jgi:hypothetical protein